MARYVLLLAVLLAFCLADRPEEAAGPRKGVQSKTTPVQLAEKIQEQSQGLNNGNVKMETELPEEWKRVEPFEMTPEYIRRYRTEYDLGCSACKIAADNFVTEVGIMSGDIKPSKRKAIFDELLERVCDDDQYPLEVAFLEKHIPGGRERARFINITKARLLWSGMGMVLAPSWVMPRARAEVIEACHYFVGKARDALLEAVLDFSGPHAADAVNFHEIMCMDLVNACNSTQVGCDEQEETCARPIREFDN